jgi:hypothetical protein
LAECHRPLARRNRVDDSPTTSGHDETATEAPMPGFRK